MVIVFSILESKQSQFLNPVITQTCFIVCPIFVPSVQLSLINRRHNRT